MITHRCTTLLLLFALFQANLPAAELAISHSTEEATLSWPSDGAGKVYTIQITPDLSNPRWIPPLPWDNWPINETTFTDPIKGNSRFYRLATTERGRVVSVTYLRSLSALLINLIIIPNIGTDLPFSATHDVDVYRVEYETVDSLLGPTFATAALCVPNSLTAPADLFSYQHGTIHRRQDAPSNPSAEEQLVGVVLA